MDLPETLAWVAAHADDLAREAERRKVGVDALLAYMLDDVFGVYANQSDDEITAEDWGEDNG